MSAETQAREVEIGGERFVTLGADDVHLVDEFGSFFRMGPRVAAAIRRIAELEEERKRVRGLLGEVADADPETRDSYEEPMCFFCGAGDWPDYNVGARYLNHREDCLWARVRAALKEAP